jgi:hypothetical protein
LLCVGQVVETGRGCFRDPGQQVHEFTVHLRHDRRKQAIVDEDGRGGTDQFRRGGARFDGAGSRRFALPGHGHLGVGSTRHHRGVLKHGVHLAGALAHQVQQFIR